MVKENRILILIIGLVGICILFSVYSEKAVCQNPLPPNISFSGESNTMYFLDRDASTLYRYNIQGKLTRVYLIKELGKDLEFKQRY